MRKKTLGTTWTSANFVFHILQEMGAELNMSISSMLTPSSLKNGFMGLPRGGKRPWRVYHRNLDVKFHSDDPEPSMWTTSTCTRLIGKLDCDLHLVKQCHGELKSACG